MHTKTIITLSTLVLLLVGFNYLNAWSAAPQNAPQNNALAPINVGGIYQVKLGDLGAVRMRAGAYCDALGNNCVATTGLGGGGGGALSINEFQMGRSGVSAANANVTTRVNFPVAFSKVPQVSVGLQQVHYNQSCGQTNLVFSVNVSAITATYFDFVTSGATGGCLQGFGTDAVSWTAFTR